jgi:hypothetical protein
MLCDLAENAQGYVISERGASVLRGLDLLFKVLLLMAGTLIGSRALFDVPLLPRWAELAAWALCSAVAIAQVVAMKLILRPRRTEKV